MMETEDLTARLAGVGFSVLSDEDAAAWMDRYWPAEARRDGGEWERLLVARRD
jgi:hypothetical protein